MRLDQHKGIENNKKSPPPRHCLQGIRCVHVSTPAINKAKRWIALASGEVIDYSKRIQQAAVQVLNATA